MSGTGGWGGPLRICGDRVFVIAEAGVNHNGELARALEMIDVAAACGADAVKFQTFVTDDLVAVDAPKAGYQARQTGGGSQRDMLKALELSHEDFRQLEARCRERAIVFLSTPFEEGSADFLDSLDVAAFKIPSGEITNLPFLAHVAAKGRPMIVSTGMADIAEVAEAVATIERTGNRAIALLHCVSNYPADPADANLRAMETLSRCFGHPVGYSDHTTGIAISIAAAALGACVIEKHFTLDRALPGPDHSASLEPAELKAMIDSIRATTLALGDGQKRPRPSERNTADVARKSLFAARPVAAGQVLDAADLRARRPGTGLSPALQRILVGRRATRDIAAGAMIEWSDLA